MTSDDAAYRSAGVDYELLDAGKREAIAAALATSALAAGHGAEAVDASRGEPAFVLRLGREQLAMVMECLGTKSAAAREYQELTGTDRFEWTGYDTVAAIVNDLCSVGARPLMVSAYFATGSPAWYSVPGRFSSLVRGWLRACRDAGAVWGGGESPMLGGLVEAAEIDLAGCGVGLIPPGRDALLGSGLRAGDEIVLIASTGLHANGASLARQAALRCGGLTTRLPDGRTFGDALLAPGAIYAALLDRLYSEQVPVSYLCHVTGHGLRKLMRANRELTYRVTSLPPVPPVLEFITGVLGLSAAQAYGTFNMGAGFAVFCPPGEGGRVVSAARGTGHAAWVSGGVEDGPRRVILEPAGVEFGGEQLRLR